MLTDDVTFDLSEPTPEIVFEELPAVVPAPKPASRTPAAQRQQAKVAPKASIPPLPPIPPVESKRNDPAKSAVLGRVPPNSPENEEYLLSCCLIDGGETLDKCIAAKLPTQAFYSPAHQAIFKTLLNGFRERRTVALEILADDLKKNGQLEAVGGVAYLMQISGRMPTTARAGYFLEEVRKLYLRRELIALSTQALEKSFADGADLEELVLDLGQDFDHIRDEAAGVDSFDKISKSLADYIFPDADPTVLLGPQNRYICRGGKLVIVAPSGTGKSVTCYQASALWATGKPFLGLTCKGPLKSLIIQAEDDDGDIGEASTSIMQAMAFTGSDAQAFRENIKIIRDDTHTGMNFLPALRAYCRSWTPDLVWINPLVNFCPGMSEERTLSDFLCGLNSINEEHQWAYVVTHHTSKPPVSKQDESRQAAKSPYARQYSAFGSSILTNWARAIINIESLPADETGKQFRFSFDKRGRRAGIAQQGEDGKLETVTRIRARHTERHVEVNGHTYPMLLWELDEEGTKQEQNKALTARENGAKGGRNLKSPPDALLECCREKWQTKDKAVEFKAIEAVQESLCPLSKTQLSKRLDDMQAAGSCVRAGALYYFPPAPVASQYEKAEPAAASMWYDRDGSPWPDEPPPGFPVE